MVNPSIALLVTYAGAFILTLPLLRIFPLSSSLAESLRRLNWASFGLAAAIVGLEIGFLLAYRAGWNVNITALAVNVNAAVVLVPVGIALFKEQPSLINILGFLYASSGSSCSINDQHAKTSNLISRRQMNMKSSLR